jgi:TatD DNase family protein
MLIDSHCHLASQRFSEDLAQVLERARGLDAIVVPSTDLEDAPRVLALHADHSWLHPAIGIHPCDAHTVNTTSTDWLSTLRELASRPEVVAIGEIGLDYFHAPPEGFTHEAWEQQQDRVVRAQLDLAAELGLNVIIHTRESHEVMLGVIRAYTGRLRAVFHCFCGTADQASELRDLNHLVSFTGNVTFKTAQDIQQTASLVPEGSFMVETDAPFLSPMPHRGKRNEPAYVLHVAEKLAQLRDCSVEHLAEVTSTTARGFFRY